MKRRESGKWEKGRKGGEDRGETVERGMETERDGERERSNHVIRD